LGCEILENRFAFSGKLHESLHVVDALFYLTIEFETFFEAGSLLIDLAGAILIGPKVRFCNLLLQFIELALLGPGVKETSARPRFEFSVGCIVQ
jgi:hypothetical protein